MAKMRTVELRALLNAERTDAMSAVAASKLSDERSTALDYYQGDMSKTMLAPDGRSKAVSTDTSDTIEGLMPPLMEIFTGGDHVVQFDPHGPEDVQAAEQETDYVNHVFTQQNPGFLILYSFIKDALISKVGIVKVRWEDKQETERETYLDQPPEAYAAIVAAEGIDVVEHTEHDGLHDVTIEGKRNASCARVDAVPPEEFGISRHARSIRECDYCFHDVARSEAALIKQGYDADQVKKLPSYIVANTIEEQARDTVDESTLRQGDDSFNSSNRLIKVTEHYVRMDYEGNDEARLYRVTTGAEDGEIMLRDGSPDVIEEDRIPFAAMTPVIITHRFWGRSVADLVKDIQEIKTALMRGMLDNLYFTLNPRTLVNENLATSETLDDLLVARPLGIIRHKGEGAVEFVTTPDITQSIYPALQYMDATREWRTGVSRQGQGIDPNALQNQVATIANQMFNASQAKVKLIARIFAETGIKDLFTLLHATIRKHCTQPAVVRLRNQWVQLDPRDWKTRNDMTVNVGLGTGSKPEQLAHLQLIIGAQTQAIPLGIVTPGNIFASAKELTKLGGHLDVDKFFTAPNPQSANQPIPPPQDPKQTEIAAKAQAEQEKIKADAAHQQMKTQADLTFQNQKMQMDGQQAQLKHDLDAQLAVMKAQLEERLANHKMAMDERHLELTTAAANHKAQLETHKANQPPKPKAAVEVKHGAKDITGPLGEAIAKFGEHMAESHAKHMEALHATLKQANAAKRVVRGKDGRVSHVEAIQ